MTPLQSSILAYVRAPVKTTVWKLRKAGLLAPPDATTWGQLFEAGR